MSLPIPLYCTKCNLLDTERLWKSKKEFCLGCREENMDRAPVGTYDVIMGPCSGCGQIEQGPSPLHHRSDENGFVIGSHCPNCHSIGRMKEIPPRR